MTRKQEENAQKKIIAYAQRAQRTLNTLNEKHYDILDSADCKLIGDALHIIRNLILRNGGNIFEQ